MGKYKLELTIKGLPKMANQLLRGHWASKVGHTKLWKQKALTAAVNQYGLKFKPAQPLVSAALCFTRVSSSEPDFDGLVSGFKAIQDFLVESKVLASDKASVIGQPIYKWEKTSPKNGHIKISVREL